MIQSEKSKEVAPLTKPIYTKCCQCFKEAYAADVRLLKEMVIMHAEVRHVADEKDDNE